MPQDLFPSATALCINKSNVDLITKGNLSHYQMIAQVEKKFREWSPATFMGFSSVGFDDEILLFTKDNIFQSFIIEGERLVNYQNQFLEKVEQFYSQRMAH